MPAELSPDGGETQGAVTDSTVGDGPGAEGGSGPVPGSGAGSTGEDVWDDIVLDEDFIRSAETDEPSARARMLAARWRQQAPDPQPWRSDEPPAVLRQRVTSKGGTTYAAITSMEQNQIAQAFVKAMRAAEQRARELGDEFGAG